MVEGKVEVVHHVFRPDDSDQNLDVGTTLPPHATALGKAVLAYDTSGAAQPRRLEAYTTRTITDPARLSKELATVRARGWAGEFEEHTVELASIAAPIRGLGGLVVGAVGLAGRVERICDSKLRHRPDLVTMVQATAQAIARDLRDDT
nr:IclR family transcriptional regulator C-terminal domain-containing protein [Kribbella solani]